MFYPKPITKQQIATIAGMSWKSGTFNTYLSNLKRAGLINPEGEKIGITEEGVEQAGIITQVNPQNILDMWLTKIKGGAGRMLKYLAILYPQSISKEELGEKTDMNHTSGTFNTYLSTLKRNGLITTERQQVRATKELFLEE